MKIFKIILLIILAFIAEISLSPNIKIGSAFPNFIVILLIFYLINFDYRKALLTAGIGGILLDLYSPMYFGVYTLSFLAIYLLAYFIFTKFISEQVFIVVFLSFFVGYLLSEIIPLLVYHGSYVTYFSSALYTSIIGIFIYYIFSANFKKTHSAYKLSDKLE